MESNDLDTACHKILIHIRGKQVIFYGNAFLHSLKNNDMLLNVGNLGIAAHFHYLSFAACMHACIVTVIKFE